MRLSATRLRITSGAAGRSFDTNARSYIAAVEAADGQTLETNVKIAINNFVVGCKNDGNWNAIKASCILSGARTLSGALVPLVGTAPTNNNFVSGDYDRKTGLIGNGSTKYLDSNRANNADPQNSKHVAMFISSWDPLVPRSLMGANPLESGRFEFERNPSSGTTNLYVSTATALSPATATPTQFLGATRTGASAFNARILGVAYSGTTTSSTPTATTLHIFRRNFSGDLGVTARLAFYSIGESLDLALLDTRITALITAFGVVIP